MTHGIGGRLIPVAVDARPSTAVTPQRRRRAVALASGHRQGPLVLDARSEALIEEWVRSGRYASAAEALRDGLRVLEAIETSEAARLDALRIEVQAGLDSGPSAPLDMGDVRAEGRRRIEASRAAPAHGG